MNCDIEKISVSVENRDGTPAGDFLAFGGGVVSPASGRLLRRIRARSALLGVVGLGYVGLPLAVEKAKAGFSVLGFDIDADKVNRVNRGENYIGDVSDGDLSEVVAAGRLMAVSDFDRLAECDVAAICVPTPLDRYKQADLTSVIESAKAVAARLHPGMLVILESTTYPGTTQEVLQPILESGGLRVGADFHLAFSPERVDPGNPTFRTGNTPKVVGGCTPACGKIAGALYEEALSAPVLVVSSPREAEMAKILENTFRIVNCALANEMALVCERLGINIWEVIEAASTKPFGFMPFFPGPGVGGHCIPIDPFYLTWRARAEDYHTRLIEMAGEINSAMPEHVIARLQDLLNERGKPLKGSRILLLGLAYKGDVGDLRESPSLKLWDILEAKGATVLPVDPYCPQVLRPGGIVETLFLTAELAASCDVALVATAHRKRVDYALLVDSAPLIFDTRNAVVPSLGESLGPIDHVILL
jgi:nucleotide sugar dehydrogenase